MARLPRLNAPGTVFHVMARGNGGQATFRDADDLGFFCGWLRRLKNETGYEVFAYCLMTNHFHLLVRTGRQDLSGFMHRLLCVFARRFNARHERSGHLFQDRFRAIPCQDARYYATVLRYVHRNPVAAGLVKAPEDWKFSGHREFLGASGQRLVDTARALELLSPEAPSLKDYLSLFGAGLAEDPLAELADRAAAVLGVLRDELRGGDKDRLVVEARRTFARAASEKGFSAAQIGRYLNCTRQGVCRMLDGRPVVELPRSPVVDVNYVPGT